MKIHKVFLGKICPTKRAPGAGDSAPFSSILLCLSILLVGRLRRPRPSAGNASRWAQDQEVLTRLFSITTVKR